MERPLSVKFPTTNLRGISHYDVLSALETKIEKDNIKSVQLKEKECIVTLSDVEGKNKLLISTINIKNRAIFFTDVDSFITNITVKDAPYEMSDNVIIAHLSKYGDLVSGSLQRGKIRGTNIDNGTRYVKILNCIPVLPLRDQIGRFSIRIFADNNRTPCRHCNETSHPCFKCPNKETYVNRIKCWQCGGNHHKKDCTEKKMCHFCNQDDHLYEACPHRLYGEYAADILEGREAENSNRWDAHDSDSNWGDGTSLNVSEGQDRPKAPSTINEAEAEGPYKSDAAAPLLNHDRDVIRPGTQNVAGNMQDTEANDDDVSITPAQRLPVSVGREVRTHDPEPEYIKYLLSNNKNKVILSDSNGCRLHILDRNIHNVSKSGAKLCDVKNVMQNIEITDVDAVVVHLGTNDLKYDETASVISNVINSLECVQTKWPEAAVAFSSILPRMGKSKVAKKFNSEAKFVNSAVAHYCVTSKKFHFLDNDAIFYENNAINRKLYNTDDPSGIHVNEEGAQVMYRNFSAFLIDGMSDEEDLDLGRAKRLRSDDSVTSQDLRASKQGRSQSD